MAETSQSLALVSEIRWICEHQRQHSPDAVAKRGAVCCVPAVSRGAPAFAYP